MTRQQKLERLQQAERMMHGAFDEATSEMYSEEDIRAFFQIVGNLAAYVAVIQADISNNYA